MSDPLRIKTLIVDDEALARIRIRDMLRHDPEIEIIGESAEGSQAVEMIRKFRPQLLFLDVQMPGADGFSVLKRLDSSQIPLVIFVTAYEQYAVRAFHVHACDYLLKPFKRKRFEEALARAKSELLNKNDSEIARRTLMVLQELQKQPKYLDRFAIKERGRVFLLKSQDVDWIEAEDNYVRLHSKKIGYLIRQTITSVEDQLDPNLFVRIHRGAIVNIERIQELQQLFHGACRVVLQDGTTLPLSKSYREKLRQFFGQQI